MPGVYVGDTKCLVFPVMCDGYIKQEYTNTNPAGTDLELRDGHWGVTDKFTIEAIITPYDVNGYGHKTGGRVDIRDSEVTVPSLTQSISSNLDTYQSYQYLGGSSPTGNRYSHKMMIYYNHNFQLYLENTTLSNVNQPAEYKIVAKICQDDADKITLESDTIIKPSNMLHGYYDEKGLYNLLTTNKTELATVESSTGNTITVPNGETDNLLTIDKGEIIYTSAGEIIGTVNSISGATITLTGSPTNSVTTKIYVSQKREALYTESTYKISCSFTKSVVTLYVNGKQVATKKITSSTLSNFYFHPSDSWIGQGQLRSYDAGSDVYSYSASKTTQFMGELFEISMYKRNEPTPSSITLSPGYSDIIFYYRFGDE